MTLSSANTQFDSYTPATTPRESRQKPLPRMFRELALEYQDFARQAGVEMLPFRKPSLPLFTTQDENQQLRIVKALEISVQICRNTRAQGQDMRDTPSLTWQALKELKLRPPSDLFSNIHDTSIIEVHSPDGLQIFRNFNFYRYCSYSLEELYCGSWDLLFERAPGILSIMKATLLKLYTGEIQGTHTLSLPVHAVRELASPLQYEIELEMQRVAALYAEGSEHPAATLVIEAARLIQSRQPGQARPAAPAPRPGLQA